MHPEAKMRLDPGRGPAIVWQAAEGLVMDRVGNIILENRKEADPLPETAARVASPTAPTLSKVSMQVLKGDGYTAIVCPVCGALTTTQLQEGRAIAYCHHCGTVAAVSIEVLSRGDKRSLTGK